MKNKLSKMTSDVMALKMDWFMGKDPFAHQEIVHEYD